MEARERTNLPWKFRPWCITSGELRTAEFTYEGEFNERGQAHGVGRQEHHATTPKLIFKGHWASGSLVTGQCHTEDGQPIDWQNNSAAQDQLSSKPQQVMQSYIKSKLEDARAAHGEADKRFAEDADISYSKTGKRPDSIDLGYETGPVKAAKMQQYQTARVGDQQETNRARASSAAEDLSKQEQMLKKAFDENQKREFNRLSGNKQGQGMAAAASSSFNLETEKFNEVTGGSLKVFSSPASATGDDENEHDNNSNSNNNSTISAEDIANWDIARKEMLKQRGKQMTTSDTIGDQFERFKLKKNKSSETKSQKKRNITEFFSKQNNQQQYQSSSTEEGDEFFVDDDLMSPDVLKKTKNVGKSRFQNLEDADEDVVVEPVSKDVLSEKPDKLRVDGNEPFVGVAAKNNRYE